MRKNSWKLGAAASVLALGGAVFAAVPAEAAQGKSLGSRSCTVNVASQARATGSQEHRINSDYKTFGYSGAYVTRYFYPYVKTASSSYVNVSGSIASASLFCDR